MRRRLFSRKPDMQGEQIQMKGKLNSPLVPVALAIVIFVADTFTDIEIAFAVLYVVVVLLSVNFLHKRGVVLVCAACMALTLLSYALTPRGDPSAGLINCLISLTAIGATTYLVLRIKSMDVSMHEARAQLAHVARVTSLGELTASIAHEVSQPLAGVVSSGNAGLRWLAGQPPNIEKATQSLERIIRDANRASEVVGRVRGLAKKANPRKVWLNINKAVLEIIALTRREVEQNRISLRTQLSDEVPLVWADRIQLQQVILNLIINAIEALGALGEEPRDLLVSLVKDGSNGVLLTVRDSGTGLDPGKLEDIFNAFYTTKHEGMGMGLAVSRSIIMDHGGRLWATPNEPRGAVFQFTLPAGREEAS
jgi:C4-dicarboxylate-specific signal transduction histidine kinase